MNARSLVLCALALAACNSTDDHGLCLGNQCVAVATSVFNPDFTGMGTLNTVDIATRAPHTAIDATLDPDTTMRIEGQELFVLMRDTGSLRIYDPKTFAVKLELTLGDTDHPAGKSYPQDFWVNDDGKIWVTLSGNDAAHSLAIVDRNNPGALAYVGLPQDPADTDGKPEPFGLYSCNDKLYVLLQSYTLDPMSYAVKYQPGRIAIVDPSSRTSRGAITLTGKNPFDIAAISGDDCNQVVVSNAAGLTTPPDGQGDLEHVDLDAGASKSVLITDNALAGRPTLLAPVNDHLMYVAQYFDPQADSMGLVLLSSVKVVAFDPTAGKVLNDVTGKFGNVNFLRVHGGNLFLGAGVFAAQEDPTKQPRGLYIGDADGKILTTPPIDLSLTPSAIALP
jgi:hypothetical protein